MRFRTIVGLGAVVVLVLVPGVAVADPVAAPGDQAVAVQRPAPRVLAALTRDLGLSAEQAMARLSREAAGPALEKTLHAKLGSRFGGAWHADDGRLQVGVTTTADAAAVRAAGATPVRVAHSEADLNQLKATLDRRANAAPDEATSWYVDLPANTVTVTSKPETAPTERWLAGAGKVRIVVASEEVRPLYNLRAGEAYGIGTSRCSTGFSVQGGFVTAGHCNKLTSGALTGPDGQALGSWGGAAYPTDDHAWVSTNGNYSPLPDTSGLGPVHGSTEAPVGASICRSGSTTGVHCGVILAKNETVNYGDGNVFGLTRTNACAEPGDSGGPFMWGAQAQGVLSGGSGNCTVGGMTLFQPVNEILSTYGLTLRTATALGGKWSIWGDIGGVTQSAPAAASFGSTMYAFHRGTNNHIYYNRTSDGYGWTGWIDVPGAGVTGDAVAASALGAQLYIFHRGTNNHIYYNRTDGTNWSGWIDVPGAGMTDKAPAAATFGNNLYVFHRGFDNLIYANRTADGTNWSGWFQVPGGGATQIAPAAAASSNSLIAFHRGFDNRIYANRTTDGTNWSGWFEVPGAGTTPSEAGAAGFGGSVFAFHRGFDNKVYGNRFDGTNWTGWVEVPAGGDTQSAPVGAQLNNTLVVIMRGLNDHLYRNVMTPL